MQHDHADKVLGNVEQETAEFQYNAYLEKLTAQQRVVWALDYLPGTHFLSSSFGIQSAVMLHMVTSISANIPVVLIDTGYLFPETYLFIDSLVKRLDLDLIVYRPLLSPAWQEARNGRLWEMGIDGLDEYNRFNKIEPMQRAKKQLNAHTWFAGLRRIQSRSRENKPILEIAKDGGYKVHPIIDWTNRDVHEYLRKHNLPYHPLWEKGYVSIGDTHTSRPLDTDMLEEETRFLGLKRECGLHE